MKRLPWVVAHRGETSDERENTLAAFESAIRVGADMIEMDVHRLADGVLVVFHNDDLGGVMLADIGYAELYELSVDARLKIPTFDQALALCSGRVRLVLELKSPCDQDLIRAVSKTRMRVDEYFVASFDPAVLLQLRRDHSGVQTALLTEGIGWSGARALLDRVAPDLWAPDCSTVDDVVLARCEQCGIGLLPWTVNDKTSMRRFLSAKSVAGIITDHAQDALELRRELRQIGTETST